MTDSRNISDLHPVLQRGANEFINRCRVAGIEVIITSTYRCVARQNQLFAQGRTVLTDSQGNPLRIVTNARGGQSWHNWRCAFDIAPLLPGTRQIDWSGGNPQWRQCGEIWEAMGGEWGGRWTNPVDMPHMQFTGGLRISDFQAGRTMPNDIEMEWEEMTEERFGGFMQAWLKGQNKLPSSKWAEPEIRKAVELGISDGSNPQALMTREQGMAMTVRSLEQLMRTLGEGG